MVTAAQAYWLNRKRRQARNEGARGPQIALSASSQAENTSIGTTIGDLSVVGGTGTWTFTKTVDADSAFTLTTGALKNAIVFNYETKTSYSVTIQATNGTDTITRTFTISVTNVLEVTLNALTIDDQTAEPSVPWSATITGKTSGSTITATSSDGTVLSVVGTTVSGTFTSAGTPTVTLHETHPDATPRDTGIGITVADVEEIAAPTMVTVVEPITNPPSFVWNVQEVPPDEVQIGDVCHVRIDEDDGQVYDSDPIAAADENPSGFGVPPLSAGPHDFEFWYTRSGVVGAKSTPVEVEIESSETTVFEDLFDTDTSILYGGPPNLSVSGGDLLLAAGTGYSEAYRQFNTLLVSGHQYRFEWSTSGSNENLQLGSSPFGSQYFGSGPVAPGLGKSTTFTATGTMLAVYFQNMVGSGGPDLHYQYFRVVDLG